MTATSTAALLGAMLLLAIIPSMSVGIVVTQSLCFGLKHGVLITLGIVLGDCIFILIAIYGLAFIASQITFLFITLKYLGGIYLMAVGIGLWCSKLKPIKIKPNRKPSLLSSFLSGLLLTLGDQKAIFFYMGFLPTFVNLQTLSRADISIILGIAILTVGSAKLGYARLAHQLNSIPHNVRIHQFISRLAGGMMTFMGLALGVRTTLDIVL